MAPSCSAASWVLLPEPRVVAISHEGLPGLQARAVSASSSSPHEAYS